MQFQGQAPRGVGVIHNEHDHPACGAKQYAAHGLKVVKEHDDLLSATRYCADDAQICDRANPPAQTYC